MENEESKPQRRARYKGTYPKSFKEKYKELQPEKYADDIQKVILKGNTPAGTHRSICVNEIMDFLAITPGQIGMDATLGYGGHSLEILKQLNHKGMLYATDVDPFELPRTKERLASFGSWQANYTEQKMTWSDEMYRMLGYETGAVAPEFKNFVARVHPEDEQHVRKINEHALLYQYHLHFHLSF
jgi:16S rRNA (cytosine1402-N4)-methyltransferase